MDKGLFLEPLENKRREAEKDLKKTKKDKVDRKIIDKTENTIIQIKQEIKDLLHSESYKLKGVESENRKFSGTIRTDGISVSIVMERPKVVHNDHRYKRPKFRSSNTDWIGSRS